MKHGGMGSPVQEQLYKACCTSLLKAAEPRTSYSVIIIVSFGVTPGRRLLSLAAKKPDGRCCLRCYLPLGAVQIATTTAKVLKRTIIALRCVPHCCLTKSD